ncbi:MAG TPA: DUF6527 family protein [Polyangiaceae bacterium]|nr:DUF6527 family protein [Polyangiaceae bacterium]
MKLKPFTDTDGHVAGFSFYCPGCEHGHVFYTAGKLVWAFDNNRESPSFQPSLLNTCEHHPDPKQRRCHLFLTAGRLLFLSDCTHDLAGQTVDLPDHWPDVGPQ